MPRGSDWIKRPKTSAGPQARHVGCAADPGAQRSEYDTPSHSTGRPSGRPLYLCPDQSPGPCDRGERLTIDKSPTTRFHKNPRRTEPDAYATSKPRRRYGKEPSRRRAPARERYRQHFSRETPMGNPPCGGVSAGEGTPGGRDYHERFARRAFASTHGVPSDHRVREGGWTNAVSSLPDRGLVTSETHRQVVPRWGRVPEKMRPPVSPPGGDMGARDLREGDPGMGE